MNPLMNYNYGSNSNISQIGSIIKMLKSGNPEQIAIYLMQKNPQFKNFIDSNRGKTPEQVANEHGINLSKIIGDNL